MFIKRSPEMEQCHFYDGSAGLIRNSFFFIFVVGSSSLSSKSVILNIRVLKFVVVGPVKSLDF